MINVGVIGYGKSAQVFHLPLIKVLPELKLYAFCSSQEETIRKNFTDIVVYSKLEDFLSDEKIDLVIITSPNHLHYPQAKAALLAHKHVVVEKPFVIEPQHGEELIKIAKEKNLKLSVYHNRRWDEGFMTLQKLIHENALGQINHYEVHYDRWRPEVLDRWRESDEFGSGLLYDLGAHLIDQALVLFGQPQQIISDIQRQRQGAKATDYFQLIFKYENMQAVLGASCLVQNPGDHLVVHGSKNSLIIKDMDPQEEELKRGLAPRTYQNFYQQMTKAILNNESVPVNPEDALGVVRIVYGLEKRAGLSAFK